MGDFTDQLCKAATTVRRIGQSVDPEGDWSRFDDYIARLKARIAS
jgi:hypothetical protein